MIKAVIFDADGVVIKSHIFDWKASKRSGVFSQNISCFVDPIFEKYFTGKRDLKSDIRKYIGGWCGDVFLDKTMNFLFEKSKIDAEVMRKIQELKQQGVRCYVGTNQEKYRTEYIKKKMGFEDLFDGVWSSADLGFKKPDIRFFESIYLRIRELQQIKKEEIMFWDDRKKNVESAQKAGLQAHVFSSLEDFENRLRQAAFGN